MADAFADEQRQLGQAWKKARKDGCLAPWQQARVYGLSEAWAEIQGEATYGKVKWIATICRGGMEIEIKRAPGGPRLPLLLW